MYSKILLEYNHYIIVIIICKCYLLVLDIDEIRALQYCDKIQNFLLAEVNSMWDTGHIVTTK